MKTARFLATEMKRLDEAGIRVFVIRGNHDALSKITAELVLPEGVKLFRGRAEAVEIERGRGERPVVVHGLSFQKPLAPESLLPSFRPPVEGAVNIGLMHTSLDGAPGHDVYAPCRLADLDASGFRYWALGHIHQRAVHEGAATVVMAGIPQGRDINEAGAKSVSLVTVRDDGAITVEERMTGIAEFRRVPLDATGIASWTDLVAALSRRLREAREATDTPHLVARVAITGATPLAWRIRRDADLLKTEADQAAAALGQAHVEKLELGIAPPAAATPIAGDALGELARLMAGDVLPSEGFRAGLGGVAAQLRGLLPAELRDLLGADEAGSDALLARIAAEGSEDVLARIAADAGDGEGG